MSWMSHKDNFGKKAKHRKTDRVKSWHIALIVIGIAAVLILTVAYFAGG